VTSRPLSARRFRSPRSAVTVTSWGANVSVTVPTGPRPPRIGSAPTWGSRPREMAARAPVAIVTRRAVRFMTTRFAGGGGCSFLRFVPGPCSEPDVDGEGEAAAAATGLEELIHGAHRDLEPPALQDPTDPGWAGRHDDPATDHHRV